MAEFKKLSEVEQIETASDNATVLVEENGEIKRVPKNEVGGGGAIATAIIRSSDYLDAIEGMKSGRAGVAITYECLNMTFEEAYQIMESGEPLVSLAMIVSIDTPITAYGFTIFAGTMLGNPCINMVFMLPEGELQFFWTADGVSTEEPNSGGK